MGFGRDSRAAFRSRTPERSAYAQRRSGPRRPLWLLLAQFLSANCAPAAAALASLAEHAALMLVKVCSTHESAVMAETMPIAFGASPRAVMFSDSHVSLFS